MKYIKFKVDDINTNIINVTRELSIFSCKIKINMVDSCIIVSEIILNEVDFIIDIIEKYYIVTEISLDNTSDFENLVISSQSDEKVLFIKSYFDFIFENLDFYKDPKTQIDIFLHGLKLDSHDSEGLIKNAFEISINLDKITYTNIINTLDLMYPDKKWHRIRTTLQSQFNDWITLNHPDILKEYPKMCLLTLIKSFLINFY